MNLKTNALLTEAVELLKNNKSNCPPSLEKRIETYLQKPDCIEQAKTLLQEVKAFAGMFSLSYIAKWMASLEGGYFSEKEFFYERMPGEQ